MSLEFVVLLAALVALALYTVRSQRAIGNKVTEATRINNDILRAIKNLDKKSSREIGKVQDQTNLLNALIPGINPSKFHYILSLTSHPARFAALEKFLPTLSRQQLAPQKIVLNIAHTDKDALPVSITEMASRGLIELNFCDDLGPGKKYIPTAQKHPEMAIIVVDDDLQLSPDLTLQLMLEHQLYPSSIIASRVHRITFDDNGTPRPFSEWDKGYEGAEGPALDLVATSGAGTLIPPHALHPQALDASAYQELAFHTDDLWWYFQAQRIGTTVRRLPGHRPLEFLPDTQDQGLWRTGNKDRNEENLVKLVKEIGVPRGNK